MREKIFHGQNFRDKFNEFGGDGIYAAWKLSYQEDIMSKGAYKELHLIITKT